MKKLLVLSGKGGTGKTTVSSAIIRISQARAAADCDVDAPNLHIINQFDGKPVKKAYIGAPKAFIDTEKCINCGKCMEFCRFDAIIREKGLYRISEFSCEGCGVCEYVCPCDAVKMLPDKAGEILLYKGEKNFSTAKLKIGRGNSGKLVTEVKKALIESCPNVSFAVFDGSPGVGCPVMASISGMDLCLIVTEPTLSGKSDLTRIAEIVLRSFVKAAVCINKYDLNLNLSNEIENWCTENKIPFVGKIPYDRSVLKAQNSGRSVYEYECPAQKALRNIYVNITEILGGMDDDC